MKLTGTAKDNRLAAPSLPREPVAAGPSLLVPVFVAIIVAAFLAIHGGIANVSGNAPSRERALFTAVNAATLTGFPETRPVGDFTAAGQLILFGLTLAGILFSLIVGGMALTRISGNRSGDGRIVWWSVALILLALGLSGMLLGEGRGLWAAAFLAVSAVGNNGLHIGPLPPVDSLQTHALLLPLAILGGLGVHVLIEVADRFRGGRPLSKHTTTTLRWTAGIYLVATLALLAFQWPGAKATSLEWQTAIASSSRQAINARSAGFPFTMATYLPRNVQWVTMGLMLIGAAPGGTAGGLKVTTLAVLFSAIRAALNGRSGGRIAGIAAVWMTVFFSMIATVVLALVTTEPQIPADRLLFLAISAITNTGLAHDPVSLSDPGLCILSAAMLAGRITPILILWWMVDTTPGENIAVG